ncbi:3',5'-cyclic adenosine monophosphate phosphodiesterase CpdA [Eubacterium plexicaudatum ASF492]|uniref:Calcineurin-like phosphoesterase domain-containing protein n=1 Tax=Eubacterium plexicaudatum ASF492 TaxID=1235802 RepID=N1ZKK5_9FIRM|nr:3',5'-cyclic adenosine monophosphate phosphodiesterase CpdA [Eubacterium plexicaudatum ASF492]
MLLLDLELKDKCDFNGLNAIDDIKRASPHTKIFVLSGKIYDNLYHIKLQEYKRDGKIVGFFETGNHEEWCSELIQMISARKVGILHFSDMHISEENDNSKQILTGFANDFKEKVDLLIFSGDVVNRGKHKEFIKAEELLIDLCDRLKIRNNVFVPGNHDIMRDTPVRNAFSHFLHFRKSMDEYAEYYEENVIYPDVEGYADYLNVVRVFPGLRTIVCGLNSATCIEDGKFGYDYGEITAEQLRQAEEKLAKVKGQYPNFLIIGAFHHNMFEPPYYFDFYNKGDTMKWIPPVKKQGLILKKSFENGLDLLLTGHSHVSSSFTMVSHNYKDKKPLHIISAGLFSEKGITPLETQLTANYLTYQIDLSGNISNMFCQPYSHKLTEVSWNKEKGYALESNKTISHD